MKYIGVYNLDEEWATCDCSHVMKGNIYKHHMKVLKLMHLDLEEGKITRYGGSLKGIAIGWLKHFYHCHNITHPQLHPSLALAVD